jgi:trehalose 6-phosphate phosphatase
MQHLLSIWPQLRKRLRDDRRTFLLFDYDGTLAPIVERPEMASIPQETEDALVKLSRWPLVGTTSGSQSRLIIGIISARSLEDVRARVGIDGLIYAGNHGLEIQGLGLDFVHPEALKAKNKLDQAYRRLEEELSVHPGAFAEHKGLSLTVHYRLVEERGVEAVKDIVDKTTRPFLESEDLVLSPGKMALEIRPNISWHKGSATNAIISGIVAPALNPNEIAAAPTRMSLSLGETALYFGDDLPDEAGFASVQEYGGMGVFVGPPDTRTCAHYRLDSPQEVGEILNLVYQQLINKPPDDD